MPQVLVVCYGNLCRSPMAAGLLRARLPRDHWTVVSAGTNAGGGEPPALLTRRVALEQEGVDLEDERSTPIDVQTITASQQILTMSRRQAATVVALVPEAADRTRLLGAFAPALEAENLPGEPFGPMVDPEEIGDPMGGDIEVYMSLYRRLARACDALTEWLLNGADPTEAPPAVADGLLNHDG